MQNAKGANFGIGEATLLRNKIVEAVAVGEGLTGPETFFDYHDVSAEKRDALQKLTRDIRGAVGRHFEVIVEIGEGLLKAKELLGHGNFLPWLAAEFRWSARTATNYMSLADYFRGKSANFADLNLTTARELMAAPADVQDEISARAETGEIIRKDEVKAKLAERPLRRSAGVGDVRLHAEDKDRQVVTFNRRDDMPRVDRISITDRACRDHRHFTFDGRRPEFSAADRAPNGSLRRGRSGRDASRRTKQAVSARHTKGSGPYVTVEARTGPSRPSKVGTSARVLTTSET